MAETAFFLLKHLLVLGGLAATCYVLGRTLTWRLGYGSAAEKAAVATTLGLAVLGQILFLFGLAGLLNKTWVLVTLAAIHIAGWRAWAEAASAARLAARREALGRRLAVPLLVAALSSPLVLLAMYPPTAFDATGYHLPQAKAFASTGSLPLLPNLIHPAFPAHGESLFAAILLLSDDVSAQGVELLAGFLTAALLAVWGRWQFGGWAGAIAASLYLGNPAVAYLLGSAYVDPALALFAVGSVYALQRWRQGREGRWLEVAGACAGAAASTKYLGLFFVALVGLAALSALRRRESRGSAAIALLILLVFVGTCHGRLALLTGNPVHPYFQKVFGQSPWTVPEADRAGARMVRSGVRGLFKNVVDVVRLPWDLVLERHRFEPHPPISPFYLLLAPAVVLGAVRDRRVRRLLLLVAVYAYVVWLMPRNVRYLFPALALGALAWGGALQAWLDAASRRYHSLASVSAWFAAILVLPGILYAGQRFAIYGPLPADNVARERFLEKMFPAYPALAFLNKTHGAQFTVYVLGAPNLDYFSEGAFRGEYNGPASYRRVFPKNGDPALLYRNLRALRVDHLLLPTSLPPRFSAPDRVLGFDRFFRLVFSDAGGRVYALDARAAAQPIRRASSDSALAFR